MPARKRIFKFILFLLFNFFALPAFTEIIALKSGDKINAPIIERNDDYVKIDVKGTIIPYRIFEIQSIDGKDVVSKNIPGGEAPQSSREQTAALPEVIESPIITAEEYLQRGIIYYSKGEFDHAIFNFDEAIKINPAYFEAYLYRGLSYADRGNAESAIADYNKAIEINPKNEEVYFVRGVAFAAIKEPDKAIADYTKAIELNPKYVQAYLNRALLSITTGKTDNAISDADKVIEINPNFPGGYYLRGLAYANKNSLEQAIRDYTKAIEINPQYKEAYVNRALARAYHILEQAKMDPNSPLAYVNAGISTIDKANYDLAIADCNKAVELSPKYMDAYIIRARIYLMANDFDNAWADIHKVESLGGVINPEMLKQLKRASGREK